MGCGCNKRKTAAPKGFANVWDFIPPDGTAEDAQPFMSPLAAKKALRQAGGGTIKRRTVAA